MKLSRKGVVLGLVVGALAGGAGGALATSGGTSTTPTTPLFAGAGGGYLGGGMCGAMFGQNSVFAAAASYLGLSETDLQTQLQAGKSLAQVAQAQGKSITGLEDGMVTAITSNLNANTALGADQKAAFLAQVKSHIDAMVNNGHQVGAGVAGRFGPGAGPMMGGMWQR